MKWTTYLALGIGVILGNGCTVNSGPEGLLPSELISKSDIYDGKHVSVRGYVVILPGRSSMYDSRQGERSPLGKCMGLRLPKGILREYRQGYTSGIDGVFRKTLCRTNEICLNYCGESGLDVGEDASFR
jgi:hypothetical protein